MLPRRRLETDMVTGNNGADLLSGGGGFDVADYSLDGGGVPPPSNWSRSPPTSPLPPASKSTTQPTRRGTIDSLIFHDFGAVRGTQQSDLLIGYPDQSTYLIGVGGNDTLIGGVATDILIGDAGNDTLWGNGSGDAIIGGADNDTIFGDVPGPGPVRPQQLRRHVRHRRRWRRPYLR